MLFNSAVFILVFLPLVLAAYYLVAARRGMRIALLSLASVAFYGFWDPRFIPLLVGSATANWLLVQWFARRRRDALPLVGVALNLAVLGVFKYFNFFAETLAAVVGAEFGRFNIILPIGISFFTFQQISYLVDLRRARRPIYGFGQYFLFVTFFPQLIAGPIVRHHELIPQFERDPRGPETWENLTRGAVLFVIGLVKKVVFADQLARIVDPLFAKAATEALTFVEAWTADIAFALQIYFDFSGYSDMAIGLALMCGFRLPINFNAPYRAASIREFWRRWHMTLSRFLRDYVYIPLGGNRRGPARQAVNVVATMLLGGLWHGAAWTFVVWGGLHGAALAVNGMWRRSGRRLPVAVGWPLTMLFVLAAWVFFRAQDFATAGGVLASMVATNGLGLAAPEDAWLIVLAVAVVLLAPTSQTVALAKLRPLRSLAGVAAAAFVFVLIFIGGAPQNEFIYFQF